MSIVRLGHIALTAPDLERAAWFAQEVIGLREVERRDETAYLTSNSRHHQLRIRAGAEHECEEIGFDVADEADLDALTSAARDAGLEVLDGSRDPHVTKSIQVSIASGPTLAFCFGVEAVTPAHYSTPGVRPRKLGHVTLSSPDCAAVREALTDVLGFRISDRLALGEHADGELSWYRCNPDHHCLGLTPGETGLHHYAFEVDSFAAFAVMGDHLLTHGIPYVWGPGRHGPGDNLFAYFEDSGGSMIEFYSDMLQIQDERTYVMPEWPDVESSAAVWGPSPPPEWFAYSTPFAGTAAARA